MAEIDRIGPTAGTDSAALDALSRAIRNPRGDIAYRAAYWLGQVGRPAVPLLVAALADSSPSTRTTASYALGLLGPEAGAAVSALARQMGGASDSVANMADWALAQIAPGGSTMLIPELRALRYGTDSERADAAAQLARWGQAAAHAIPLLIRAMADSVALVASSAGDGLVAIGARAIPALQAVQQQSENPALRARAQLVLTRIRPHSHF